MKRPWCCVEPRCQPVHQLANRADLSTPEPGDSFVCFGRMPAGIEFTYDGEQHANDLRSCSYTPLKGLIANQENEDDWRMLAAAYTAALTACFEEGARPDVCAECKPPSGTHPGPANPPGAPRDVCPHCKRRLSYSEVVCGSCHPHGVSAEEGAEG